MGVNSLWQNEVLLSIKNINKHAQIFKDRSYNIIKCNAQFVIHLIPNKNFFLPDELVQLQEKFNKNGIFLIQLWEDVWLTRKKQVLSRINSFLGLNKRYYARKANVVTLSMEEIKNFLNLNHLQGYIKAKYNFALIYEGEIIAAANFSESREMNQIGEGYLSAELIRFASKDGITVVGGLSKLIKHFLKQVKINDLMTYADRDWSLGKGYNKLGFQLTAITEPRFLYLDQNKLNRYFPHRLPKIIISDFEKQDILNLEDYLASNSYIKIFNTGNLKYHLYQ